MPRHKKTSQKRQTKKQNIHNVITQVKKIEKEWQQTPNKLISLLEKQAKTQTKQEVKMEKAVGKLSKLIQMSETRLAKAAASKNPAIARRKTKSIQKELKAQTKLYQQLSHELDNLTQSIELVTQKHDRLIALDKYINNFDKANNAATKATKVKKLKSKNNQENIQTQHTDFSNDEEVLNTEEVLETA